MLVQLSRPSQHTCETGFINEASVAPTTGVSCVCTTGSGQTVIITDTMIITESVLISQ